MTLGSQTSLGLTEVSLSILTIVLNVPFLIIGSRQLGKMFMVKSGYSMAVFSVFVEIFKPLENATSETILAVCFGGVILGLGVGIIITVCAADTGDVIPVKASPAAKHNAASCCFFMNVTLLCV